MSGFNSDMQLVSSIQYFSNTTTPNLSADAEFNAIKARMAGCIIELRVDNQRRCTNAVGWSTFADFSFKGPANVVFYSLNKNLRFSEQPLIIGKDLVGMNAEGNRTGKPNKSFYDASVKENAVDLGAGDLRQLVYVRNYYTKKSGSDEGAEGHGEITLRQTEKFKYGLNIVMLAPQSSNIVPLPIIIDPDTGNMGQDGKP